MAVRGLRRVILLDALGTLLALEPPAPRLRRNLARRCGVRVSEEEARRAVAAEIAYYRAHLNEGRDEASLADLRRRCALAAGGALGAEVSVEVLMASLEFTPFPDARPALEAARERGEKLVVVSNWDVSLRDVLARAGLEPLLDAVVVSAAVGAAKPDPAIFERALTLAGAEPSEAIHVGDSLVEDVAGARAAGIEPVLIARAGTPRPPGVRTVLSLAELA